MPQNNEKVAWDAYCAHELVQLVPLLRTFGYELDIEQPHIKGERFLMYAVTTTSGRKLILLGTNTRGQRVVIKVARDHAGILELKHEQLCKKILKQINFAGEIFYTPTEIEVFEISGYFVSVQLFIDQKHTFLELTLSEQFSLAIKAFKGQESAHATTSKHRRLIKNVFGIRNACNYLENFKNFENNIISVLVEHKDIASLLSRAQGLLHENEHTIEQYCGFLTHTDFVPHNIRIVGEEIYLLDHSSLTFGNKYEGWARFLNFMTLYNPPLVKLLTEYVEKNRTSEETVSLKMMRVYRLGEIIWYYTNTLSKSSGNLLLLNTARVHFWKAVLDALLQNARVSPSVITEYEKTRDSLRSEDEKERQHKLH